MRVVYVDRFGQSSTEEYRGVTQVDIKDGGLFIEINKTTVVGLASGVWKEFTDTEEEE